MDFMTPEQRHRNMCNVKQENTTPERILMRELRNLHIWFSCHCKELPGKPDLIFKRKKTVVFIDSEFWHGRSRLPKSNIEFWSKKFEYNRKHDAEVSSKLEEAGWKVIRFSDKQIKHDLQNCVKLILLAIGRSEDVCNYTKEK